MLQTVGEGGFAGGGLRVVQEAFQLFPARHVVKPTVMMRWEMSSCSVEFEPVDASRPADVITYRDVMPLHASDAVTMARRVLNTFWT